MSMGKAVSAGLALAALSFLVLTTSAAYGLFLILSTGIAQAIGHRL